MDGTVLGGLLGTRVVRVEGRKFVGATVGFVGLRDGVTEGLDDGTRLGNLDGRIDGVVVGLDDVG